MAFNEESDIERARRELERLFGYPPGAFDPASDFFKDIQRINRALGEGVELLQDIMSRRTLHERIEALHPDQPISRARRAIEHVMNLPRELPEIHLPPLDGLWKGD